MSDNLNEQGSGSSFEDIKGGNGQTYTSEQINEMFRNRYSKMKRQAESEVKTEYDKKSAELHKREMKLLAREKLAARNLPADLVDVLECSDELDLDTKLNLLQRTYKTDNSIGGSNQEGAKPAGAGFSVGAMKGGPAGGGVFVADPIRQAMGLNRKE